MDVATASGFAALAAGGKMWVGSAMSMTFGGGPDGKVAHTLDLRLGSTRRPTSPPVRGDHWFEPQPKLGKSMPLLCHTPCKGHTSAQGSQYMAPALHTPKGTIHQSWGS